MNAARLLSPARLVWGVCLGLALAGPLPAHASVPEDEALARGFARARAQWAQGDTLGARMLLEDLPPISEPALRTRWARLLRLLGRPVGEGLPEERGDEWERFLSALEGSRLEYAPESASTSGGSQERTADPVRRWTEVVALRRAAAAAATGEDPTPWLDEVDPRGPLGPRAEFFRLLSAEAPAARWQAWLQEHPAHPLAADARRWLAARALEEGDFALAQAVAREGESARAARAAALAAVLADSLRLRQSSRSLWEEEAGVVVHVDRVALWQARADRVEALLRGDDVPVPVLPWTTNAAVETSIPPLEKAEREEEVRLRSAWRRSSQTWQRARRDSLDFEVERRSRHRYLDRGERELALVRARLDSIVSALAAAAERSPGLVDSLRRVETSLLSRVRSRSTAMSDRARSQAAASVALRWLFPDGPMGRRDPAPRDGVPLPSVHLRAEADWARQAEVDLDSLRVKTARALHRSFSEVFGRRLTEAVGDQSRAAASWVARADSIARGLRLARAAMDEDPRWLAVLSRAERARDELAAATSALRDWRLAVTRRVYERALEENAAEEEAWLYLDAAATGELALGAPAGAQRDRLLDEARQRWARFLQLDPDPRVRPDARDRWAELELTAAREDFQARMGDWLRDEGRDSRRLAPLLDIGVALDLMRAILREDPGYAHRDRVLFELGMLLADQGDSEAEQYLDRLVHEDPDSPLRAKAELRRGELRFDAGDARGALPSLRIAAERGAPEVAAIALYKLGWSATRVGRSAEAIGAFRRLVDLYEEEGADTLPFDLSAEARELLLRSLARAGGALAFERTFPSTSSASDAQPEETPSDRQARLEREAGLLYELSALLEGYALEDDVRAADELFLRRYPLDGRALTVAQRRVAAAFDERGVGTRARVLAEPFVHGREWARAQESDSLRVAGDRFAREVFVAAVAGAHREARASAERADWPALRSAYEELLALWPEEPEAPRWASLAGECAREEGDLEAALAWFDRAAAGEGELPAEAAWQAVATLDASYRTQAESGAPADSIAGRLLARIDRTRAREDLPPDRERALQWRGIQVALALGRDAEVVERVDAYGVEHPGDPQWLRALQWRAEAEYRRERFDHASQAFEELATAATAAGADSIAAAARPWVVHSADLDAQSRLDEDPAEAARRWRALVAAHPGYEHADRALYRAGLAHAAAGDTLAAETDFAALVKDYPSSEFFEDAYGNRIAQFEARGDWASAAEAVLAFATARPDHPEAAGSLLHAADLLERAGDPGGRDRVLDEYLRSHPEDLQTTASVLIERAEAEVSRREDGPAVAALEDFAREHPELAPEDLLARVAFERVERDWPTYESLVLDQPLEASLARKRDAMQSLLERYGRVAERRVQPWAQAAAYRLGAVLVHMADALRASERPPGLEGDDRLAYDEVLEEQAYQFEDKGEQAWRELLRHADPDADPRLVAWIAKTRAALFPRTAQRFLHQPSFEFPVLESGRSGE